MLFIFLKFFLGIFTLTLIMTHPIEGVIFTVITIFYFNYFCKNWKCIIDNNKQKDSKEENINKLKSTFQKNRQEIDFILNNKNSKIKSYKERFFISFIRFIFFSVLIIITLKFMEIQDIEILTFNFLQILFFAIIGFYYGFFKSIFSFLISFILVQGLDLTAFGYCPAKIGFENFDFQITHIFLFFFFIEYLSILAPLRKSIKELYDEKITIEKYSYIIDSISEHEDNNSFFTPFSLLLSLLITFTLFYNMNIDTNSNINLYFEILSYNTNTISPYLEQIFNGKGVILSLLHIALTLLIFMFTIFSPVMLFFIIFYIMEIYNQINIKLPFFLLKTLLYHNFILRKTHTHSSPKHKSYYITKNNRIEYSINDSCSIDKKGIVIDLFLFTKTEQIYTQIGSKKEWVDSGKPMYHGENAPQKLIEVPEYGWEDTLKELYIYIMPYGLVNDEPIQISITEKSPLEFLEKNNTLINNTITQMIMGKMIYSSTKLENVEIPTKTNNFVKGLKIFLLTLVIVSIFDIDIQDSPKIWWEYISKYTINIVTLYSLTLIIIGIFQTIKNWIEVFLEKKT